MRRALQAVEVLSDITRNSLLDPAAIERERGVIMREMQEVYRQCVARAAAACTRGVLALPSV